MRLLLGEFKLMSIYDLIDHSAYQTKEVYVWRCSSCKQEKALTFRKTDEKTLIKHCPRCDKMNPNDLNWKELYDFINLLPELAHRLDADGFRNVVSKTAVEIIDKIERSSS